MATDPCAPVPGTLVVPWRGKVCRWGPKDDRTVTFGRNSEDVHLCVGEEDLGVSRVHGVLTCLGGRWWLRNTGRRPIEIEDVDTVWPHDDPAPLPDGYSSLRVTGCDARHSIEVLVVGASGWEPARRARSTTLPVVGEWDLDDRERLAVVAIAQDFLRGAQTEPQPRSWSEAATLLREVDPDGNWKDKSVERVVGALRMRMAASGQDGLTAGEERNAGDRLKRTLIKVLRESGAIGTRDLRLIDPEPDEP